MKNWIWYDVRSEIMNSTAKMFLSKRKQHDVGRRRSNGSRRELGERWENERREEELSRLLIERRNARRVIPSDVPYHLSG